VSVVERLAADVARQHFRPDAAQNHAAAQLEKLRLALVAQPRGYGFWRSRLMRWSTNRAAIEPVRGLYLWGGVGRGKTYLMDLFFESLPFGARQRSHFYRFMRGVHKELQSVRLRSNPLEIIAHRIARRTRIICFDEFFVADIADAMILAGLFEGLFRRGVSLVATSNQPPQDLYNDGLQRQRFLPAIELIQRHVEVLRVDGGVDYRLRQLESGATYLDSHAADVESKLSNLFDILSGDAQASAANVAVEGRSIAARRLSDSVVWFEFGQLCEGPRSQNDYIELARSFHTVVVANVPVLDAARDDAARRLVMLIDEFYDRGVKVIVSAAAEPAQLYRGERLQFEFQRTASRLMEMRSGAYLSRAHRA
jgi:cell division protein ZapE